MSLALQGGEKVASLDKHKQEKYASIEPYLDKCITVEKCKAGHSCCVCTF
jgi:hypothetical protein